MKALFISYSEELTLNNFMALSPPPQDAIDARERAVERIKFELDTKYRLHPNNFIKRGDYKKHCICVLNDEGWDDVRIDLIGSNGNDGLHYGEINAINSN